MTSSKKKLRTAQGSGGVAAREQKRPLGLLGLLVGALAFLLYVNTVNHGYVIDDFSLIKDNWLVQRGLAGIPTILKTSYRYGYWNDDGMLYRPLSLVMFAAEWELFPARPSVNHFMNIALYALLGGLLYVTLKSILPISLARVSFLASLLFVAHPIHTEVVANIKSRDEILSFLLILVAINLLLKYVRDDSVAMLGLAVACYFLAFLAKESAITFLAIIPLILFFFTRVPVKKNVMISALFGVAALAYILIRAAVLGDVIRDRPIDLLDNVLVSAPDMMSRLATAVWLLGRYLVLLLFPHPLVSDYSFKQIQIINPGDYRAILSLLLHLALGAYAFARFKSKSLVVFGILFYLITMSIYSNIFITIGSSFAERFLFVPSLGFCLVVAVGLDSLFSASPGKGQGIRYAPAVMAVLLVILYSAKTVERNREWRDELTLYSSDVKKSPDSARLHYNYGLVLVKDKAVKASDSAERDKYLDMAISEFSKAANIHPSYGDAYNQMGAAYSRKNNHQKALENYSVALKYSPEKAEIHNNLGAVYFYSKEYEKALEVYLRAVKYSPRFADAYRNVGSTYATLGRLDEAIQAFQKGIEYDPNSAVMHYYLGIIYQRKGDLARAKQHTDRAYQLDPSVGK